jgi:hypothetical protein
MDGIFIVRLCYPFTALSTEFGDRTLMESMGSTQYMDDISIVRLCYPFTVGAKKEFDG